MLALIQRVKEGKVETGGKLKGKIGKGYVILLGVKTGDSEKEVEMLVQKTVNLRIMPNSQDKMNLSILEAGGSILVISQFTLYANTKKGRRPSFVHCAVPETARKLYLLFIEELKKMGVGKVETGEFGSYMKVTIINDGPVTIMLDSDD